MKQLLEYWPILAAIIGAFAAWTGALVVATWSILNWITGKFESVSAKLEVQDARRIEMKEAVLLEIRERSHTLQGRMDVQHTMTDEKIDALKDKIGELTARVAALEAIERART